MDMSQMSGTKTKIPQIWYDVVGLDGREGLQKKRKHSPFASVVHFARARIDSKFSTGHNLPDIYNYRCGGKFDTFSLCSGLPAQDQQRETELRVRRLKCDQNPKVLIICFLNFSSEKMIVAVLSRLPH
ncbi:hypothetical protein RUM44_011710, partial [Polyplax serrata]